jgi:hypothetical protein
MSSTATSISAPQRSSSYSTTTRTTRYRLSLCLDACDFPHVARDIRQHLVKGSLSDEVYQHKIFVEILTGGEYAARAKVHPPRQKKGEKIIFGIIIIIIFSS